MDLGKFFKDLADKILVTEYPDYCDMCQDMSEENCKICNDNRVYNILSGKEITGRKPKLIRR